MKLNNLWVIMIMLCCIFLANTAYCLNTAKKTELANVLSDMKQYNPRYNIKLLEKALAVYGDDDPWASKVYYQIGMDYYSMDRYSEAINAFDKSIQLPETWDDLHVSSFNRMIESYKMLGDIRGGILAAEKIINNNGLQSNNLRASAKIAKRSLETELSNNREMIKSHESSILQDELAKVSFYENNGAIIKEEIVTGDKVPALLLKHRGGPSVVEEIYHASSSRYRILMLYYYKNGDITKAIATSDKFLSYYPQDEAAPYVAMQRQELKKGNSLGYQLSSSDLESIVKQYPTNTGLGQAVLYRLANAYLDEGKQSEAIAIFMDIFNYKQKSDDKEYNAHLSVDSAINLYQIYQEDNNIAKEISILEAAVKRFPDQSFEAKRLLSDLNISIAKKIILLAVIIFALIACIMKINKKHNKKMQLI